MTVWARLVWQAADPVAHSAELAARLGADLAGTAFDVVPWQRESPADDPHPGGRLVFEPATGDTGGDAAVSSPPRNQGTSLRLAGVGWATVELDRAEVELAEWLAAEDSRADDADEPLLGARARVRPTDGLPGGTLVLLEPTTEGRLAASLVRDGEGPCVLYLRASGGLDAWVAAARRRDVPLSTGADGPFGAGVLVPGVDRAGPHVIVTG
jgi:hypothetical protein